MGIKGSKKQPIVSQYISPGHIATILARHFRNRNPTEDMVDFGLLSNILDL